MHKRLWSGVVAVALAAAALAVPTVAHAEEALQLVLTEFQFEPGRLVLEAGKTYRLELVNRGTVEHEFMVGRELVGAPAHGYRYNFFEGMEVQVQFEGGALETEGLVEIEVEPGATVRLVFSVPEGKRGQWEVGCFVPGHYELGMKGVLTVR